MDNNDSIRLLTQQELKIVQKDNPAIIILPVWEEQFKEAKEILKQKKQDEDKSPILKETEESLQFFGIKMDFHRAKNEYLAHLESLPLPVAITRWLNELGCDEKRRNYAKYITDLKHKKIFPEYDLAGNIYSVGHFRATDHEANIEYFKNDNKLSAIQRNKRIECYYSFLIYLEEISEGWFKKEKRLIILHLSLSTNNPEVSEWFYNACNDLEMAQDLLINPLCYAGLLYYLQQATEKALKAFLLFNGQKIENNHGIIKFLNNCCIFDQSLTAYENFVKNIQPYNTKSRYPGEGYKIPSLLYVKEEIKNAHKLLKHIQNKMTI